MKFISISGVTTEEELFQLSLMNKRIPLFRIDEYKLVVGFLASEKSMKGDNSKRQPSPHQLGVLGIKALNYNLVPALHYHTKNPKSLVKQLIEVVGYTGNIFPLLQLNVKDIPYSVLNSVIEYFNGVIYKLRDNYKKVQGNEMDYWNELKEISNKLEYIMYDPSHGKGKEFSIENLKPYELKPVNMKLVVAGGFTPENTEQRLREILERHDNVCVDAESGLRNDEDELDLDKCREYLKACGRAMIDRD